MYNKLMMIQGHYNHIHALVHVVVGISDINTSI